MSRKETRPRSDFSLRYLATQKLEESLSSATAVAILGSFLSILMVFLTLLITSSVSFTYSSSEAANADDTGDMKRLMPDRDRKLRRHHRNDTAGVAGELTVFLRLIGVRGFVVVEVAVGVIEAMGERYTDKRERNVFFRERDTQIREREMYFSGKNKLRLVATLAYRLIFVVCLWLNGDPNLIAFSYM